MKAKTTALVILAILIGACASMRKIEVGSGSATSYSVSVYNSHSSTLTVSYTDTGGKTHELGPVSAKQTVPFVIPGAVGSRVSVAGVTSGGTQYTGSATLGTTTKVTL